MKLKVKAFLFAFKIIIKTLPKSFMIHYNAYVACNTNLNPFGVESNGQGEVVIIGTPKKYE